MNENKSHIPGIYNYCDRWCEKCSFTSNCLLFTNESKITAHEILNNGELPDIAKIFDEDFGKDMESSDEDFDFDFNDDEEFDDSYEDEEPEIENRLAEIKKNYLSQLGDEYFKKTNALIKELTKKFNISNSETKIAFSPEHANIFENYEILNWYHMFIKIKIDRALQSKLEYIEEDDEEMKNYAAYDMNGTSKIAAIAVDKSITALNKLHGDLIDHENEISELLIIAGKLRNSIDEEFPDYKSFIRPGLDE